jgi:hypothetical protein
MKSPRPESFAGQGLVQGCGAAWYCLETRRIRAAAMMLRCAMELGMIRLSYPEMLRVSLSFVYDLHHVKSKTKIAPRLGLGHGAGLFQRKLRIYPRQDSC